ncbi:retrovirus-related Pol polyprotein from transposon 17.6 [Trichonephila clavipes]|nr:retrovirus-related Pol polyprotein from transposon 17.6 [Trichonephila clavipes]
MPFGLCNAPATFERLMETVLGGLSYEACLVYLDDIFTMGRSFEEHLKNIRRVLQKLKEANLKLSSSKCHLFRREVTYLGHIISAEGVRTDPDKISAVKDWNCPSDVHQLRSFLGLCTYYRKFVKNFSTIARPLHKLTEAKQKFIWTFDCNNDFNKLKDALTSAPILAYPEIGKQFILDTDASHESIGAVLSQEIDEGQIARWIQRLQEYDVEIRHRKGSAHGNADALSRRPCPESCKYCSRIEKKFGVIGPIVSQVTTPSTSALDPWSDESVRKDQLADSEIKPIMEFKESSDEKPSWQDIAPFHPTTKRYWALWDSLHVKNCVLYRKWESDDGKTFSRPKDAPLVPEEYIEKLQARMEEMNHLARERIGMDSEKMNRYDARATGHDFREGDNVWLWNPKRRKGLSPKLQTNWEGPYTVLKGQNDVVVRIQNSPHSKPKVIHYNRLAPYLVQD